MTYLGAFEARDRCEVCGDGAPREIVAVPFHAGGVGDHIREHYTRGVAWDLLAETPYVLLECEVCSFLWQRYVLREPWLNELYDRWIDTGASLSKKDEADLALYTRYASEVIGILRHMKRAPHEVKVLDFGMGWGHWCLMAKAFGLSVKGQELSQARLEHAAANGIKTVRDLNELNDGGLDFVRLDQVLEHVVEPGTVLERLARLLRPGGLMFIGVPNRDKMGAPLDPETGRPRKAVAPLEHVNCFNRASLVRLARQHGLTPIDLPPVEVLPQVRPTLRQRAYKVREAILNRNKVESTNVYFIRATL